jgi:hypothetical protein
VAKSGSVGNLSQLAKDSAGDGATPTSAGAGGQQQQRAGSGSTFDDILKGIEKDKGKTKKRSFF